jgi:hypothetical protein
MIIAPLLQIHQLSSDLNYLFFLAELESSPLKEQKIGGRSDQFNNISK